MKARLGDDQGQSHIGPVFRLDGSEALKSFATIVVFICDF
jgi:hypothetical protein